MTREEIISHAGSRLGDQSAGFLTVLDGLFNFVLGDLAASEVIGALRQVKTVTIVEDQIPYTMATIIGTAGATGRLVSLTVWAWGTNGQIPRLDDGTFADYRLSTGEDYRGEWRGWRPYPTEQTIQVWPPADAEASTATAEALVEVPPTVIASGDDIAEIEFNDLETIVYGLQCRGAGYAEDSAADFKKFYPLYELGKKHMWGRRFNSRCGRIPSE